MNKILRNVGIGADDNMAARHGKTRRTRRPEARLAPIAAGIALCAGLTGAGFEVRAATYKPDSCNSPKGTGPDGVSYPAGKGPVDGSGLWSNVLGCDADGGGYVGVQVLGFNASATGNGATALGLAATAAIRSTAVGMQAGATAAGSTALGQWARATAAGSVAIGGNTSSNTAAAGAQASGLSAVAIAGESRALGQDSVALGTRAEARTAQGIALGAGAVAVHSGDVALGAGSVTEAAIATAGATIAGVSYAYAGASPSSMVSVGGSGAERTITNVAAGRVSAASTDAVNGSQLQATNQAVDALADRAVAYDGKSGDPKSLITLAGAASTDGGATGGTRLSNLARGALSATSTDAVNGSQLHETNQDVLKVGDRVTTMGNTVTTMGDTVTRMGDNVTNLGDTVTRMGDTVTNLGDTVTGMGGTVTTLGNTLTSLGDTLAHLTGDTSSAYTDANGLGIRYARTNERGLAPSDAYAQSPGSTALGYNARATADNALALGREAQASHAGSVALGANAVADGTTLAVAAYRAGTAALAGVTPVGEVSVGAAGAERRITHVAAGALDTDAVNVSQLKSVAENVGSLGDRAVTYDGKSGDPKSLITLAGAASTDGGATGGTRLSNLARGALSATSTDAVNGSQLHETNQDVLKVGDRVTTMGNTVTTMGDTVTRMGDSVTNLGDTVTRMGDNVTNLGDTVTRMGDTVTNLGDTVTGMGDTVTTQGNTLTSLGGTLANLTGDTSAAYTDANGLGIRYARTNERGLTPSDAYAQNPGSTALGYNARATADNALALGRDAQASHAGSVALGANAVADGATLAVAAYRAGTAALAGAAPVGEVSVGAAGAERRITHVAAGALDSDAVNVSQLKSVAENVGSLGDRAVTYDGKSGDPKTLITLAGAASTDGGATGGTRLGNLARGALSATSTDAVNGSQLHETNQDVLKVGDRVTTMGNTVTTMGDTVTRMGDTVTNLGDTVTGMGDRLTNLGGSLTSLTGDTSLVNKAANGLGIRYARTNEAGLAEDDAYAQGVGSTALGYNARAMADNALALGRDAQASQAGGVALGAGSISKVEAGAAGYVPQGGDGAAVNATRSTLAAVSVGDVDTGKYRQITGLAAGTVDSDAVNVSQLKALASNVSGLDAGGVKYDRNPDGAINYGMVTLNPGGSATVLRNVARGAVSADSADAVNGSQLFETNQYVKSIGDTVNNFTQGGAGIKYFHANGGASAVLPDSQANGLGSIAMGPGAVANGGNSVALGDGATAGKDGDVALGAGAVADRGAETYAGKYSDVQNKSAGTVSVGASGSERTLSNLADGRQATDAVNLRQLDGALKQANDYTDKRIQDVAGNVLQVGDQLTKLDERMTGVEDDVANIGNGAAGMFQTSQEAKAATPPKASGGNSAAGGAGAVASGRNSTAIGNGAQASGAGATALGNGSKASANNAVALGADSIADRDNSVSVGAAGTERQVVNVARGTAGTDAVNLNQLREIESGMNGQVAGLRKDVQGLDNRLSAGVATAMAMSALPQAYLPGRSMFSMGGGAWRGESGFAMGLSTVSDSGRWVLKGLASSSSRGDYGASVGVGYQW